MADYLRVTPTSERLDPESIPRVLDSHHKLTTPGTSGLGAKLNPFHSNTPPRFEFLAISDGPDDPVEFFYGADAHLDTLEKRLRSIYPATFDIERVDVARFVDIANDADLWLVLEEAIDELIQVGIPEAVVEHSDGEV